MSQDSNPHSGNNADAHLSSHLVIDTPENLQLEADIAGFASRCAAALIDYVILLLALFFVELLIRYQIFGSNFYLNNTVLIVAQFVLITFYHLFFEVIWRGQTPGKRALGLRVARTNGLPLTMSAILIRDLVRLFDYFPLFYGVGLSVMFFSRRNQRLGDMAAGTVVIRELASLKSKDLQSGRKFRYHRIRIHDPVPHYIRVDALTEEDRYLVISYMERRGESNASDYTARLIARRLADRMNSVQPADIPNLPHPDAFIEWVARAMELNPPSAFRTDLGEPGEPQTTTAEQDVQSPF